MPIGLGVLHRDVKPANVLLAADGSPKLADFNVSFSSKLDGATPAAYFGGSLAYMSPEQLEASNPDHSRQPDELDGRSDVYSLAVMLWEMLTGTRPFGEERVAANMGKTLGNWPSGGGRACRQRRLPRCREICPAGMEEVLLELPFARCRGSPGDGRRDGPAIGNLLAAASAAFVPAAPRHDSRG